MSSIVEAAPTITEVLLSLAFDTINSYLLKINSQVVWCFWYIYFLFAILNLLMKKYKTNSIFKGSLFTLAATVK